MTKLKTLEDLLNKGKITRRDFLARMSALGLTAAVSPMLEISPARAETPKRGGRLKLASHSGQTTEVLDITRIMDIMAQMVKRTVNGISVKDETLAVDVIKEIGIGKDYLSHDSTYRHMRTLSASRIFDRTMREQWEQAGHTDIYTKATQKAREVLETHVPKPLPDDVRKEIRSIVELAEAESSVSKKAQ
jgi:trimethylamine--corrinoid protein Co-methyltransferase